MGVVVDPLAGRGDPLAGGDDRGVTDNGNQFTVAARLDAKDAKAVFGVVVGDALDEAGQYFLVGWFGLGFHASAITETAQRLRWRRV